MHCVKEEFGLGRQQAVTDEFLCIEAGCVDEMYVIGCLKQSQHGSRSGRFPFKWTEASKSDV